jgi:pilus assembly protein CpaC
MRLNCGRHRFRLRTSRRIARPGSLGASTAAALCLVAAALLGFALEPGPAAAVEVSTLPGRPSIDLPVGQGRLLHFDQAVESVLIADPSVADLRVIAPDVIYAYGKKSGTTNLIVISADRKVQASVEFRVTPDVRAARDAQHQLQPTTTLELTLFGDRVIVEGHAKSVEEALDTAAVAQTFSPPNQPPLNTATVAGSQQVNIRVRFAEVSRSELVSLGIDWSVFINSGAFHFGLVRTGAAQGGDLRGSFNDGTVNVDVLIDALHRNGVLTILAEPNLTAVTGQTASFLAGGEIPVPVDQGDRGISVEYKPYGVSLQFTPTVLEKSRIGLRVTPEVSALSNAGAVHVRGFAIPGLTVRRADTTVEVASGQTFAIAGLFQREMSRDIDKFPILGDAPVLGALFQSARYRRNETELVILITPYLVDPVREKRVATPLDNPAGRKPVAVVGSTKSDGSSGLIFK